MAPQLTLDLIRRFPKNGPTDPIAYYAKPFTGWLFRERINLGLRLLPARRYKRAMEIGYGSGAVQAMLSSVADTCHGIDLDADPEVATRILASLGYTSTLQRGNAYALPYPDGHFDLVASFSTFEHLAEYQTALAEVRRVLEPGGHFLLGMPAVNRMMEVGFLAIGFKGIDDHHVTTPKQVEAAFENHGLRLLGTRRLTLPVPGAPGMPVYYDWLLERT